MYKNKVKYILKVLKIKKLRPSWCAMLFSHLCFPRIIQNAECNIYELKLTDGVIPLREHLRAMNYKTKVYSAPPLHTDAISEGMSSSWSKNTINNSSPKTLSDEYSNAKETRKI